VPILSDLAKRHGDENSYVEALLLDTKPLREPKDREMFLGSSKEGPTDSPMVGFLLQAETGVPRGIPSLEKVPRSRTRIAPQL